MRPMPAPLGLYIHIPFCKSKCVYCDFYSLPRSESRMDAYVSALTPQLAAWRESAADCSWHGIRTTEALKTVMYLILFIMMMLLLLPMTDGRKICMEQEITLF